MTKTTHLSAILFSDIEGYTSMMQKDEKSTLLLLDRYQQTLAKMVSKHGGEIVKNYGDGSICLFSSAAESVKCAIEIQKSLRLYPEVPLRIGLNLGDVHRKGDDVYGDAINVASRLESMGVAGNILLSYSMYEKVKTHPEFEFQSLGNFNFKNVDGSLEVFAVAYKGFTIPRRKELIGKFKKKDRKIRRFWPVGLIVMAVVLYFVQREYQSNADLAKIEVGNQIAVLEFENKTGDPKYDIAGEMAVDWILHGITQYKIGQVISPKIIKDYSKALQKASVVPNLLDPANSVLTDYLNPSKIINGKFYLNNKRLRFLCSITDGNNTNIVDINAKALPAVECDTSSPLDCIEELKQRILTYLTEDEQSQNLQETPPKYEAYQYLLQAKIEQYKNDEEHLRLLDMAIAMDSTYFEPKTYKLVHYYNAGNYAVADSLLQELLISTKSNDRQRNLYKFYEALLLGKNKNVHRYYQKEYNYAPLDMEINSSMMTIALQFTNKPMEVDSIYQKIDMKKMDLLECNYCEDRYYIKALADLEFKNYRKVIDLLSQFSNVEGLEKLKKILIRAHIKKGNFAKADKILRNIQADANQYDWLEIFLYNAKDLLVEDKLNKADKYLDEIIDAVDQAPDSIGTKNKKIKAESLFFKGEYQSVESLFEEILQAQPKLIEQKAMLAITYQKNGKTDKAQRQLAQIEGLRGKYQYGSVDYALAQYFAANEDDERAINHLTKAVTAGRWYDTTSFQNDPLFKSYIQRDDFKKVMNLSH